MLLQSPLSPVSHLSPALQKKLLRREKRQRKHFRSSGTPTPLVLEERPLASDPWQVHQISLPGDRNEIIDTQTFDSLLDLAFEQAVTEGHREE